MDTGRKHKATLGHESWRRVLDLSLLCSAHSDPSTNQFTYSRGSACLLPGDTLVG